MNQLLTDIYQKIELDFGADATTVQDEIDQLDAKTKGLIGPRLVRAIIYLAGGNLARLREKIELVRTDWRDVLLQAEYSYPDTSRVRDFNKTFHELGLMEKPRT